MKKILYITLIFLFPSLSLAWIPQMQFLLNPRYAQVQIVNPMPYNTFCQGYLFAQTQTGVPANIWYAGWVPAFGSQVVYLYSNGPLLFVNTWASIDCQP